MWDNVRKQTVVPSNCEIVLDQVHDDIVAGWRLKNEKMALTALEIVAKGLTLSHVPRFGQGSALWCE